MNNEEIKEVEQDGFVVLKDEFGDIINYDENDEFNTMGKGDEEEDDK